MTTTDIPIIESEFQMQSGPLYQVKGCIPKVIYRISTLIHFTTQRILTIERDMKHHQPTELSTLHSTLHGRQRRHERLIEKVDLQRARRYGMVEKSRKGRLKYTYGGVVFIYDPKRNIEITSFPSSDGSSSLSGTRITKPIILPKIGKLKATELIEREQKRQVLLDDKTSWSSHSVLVVDMSGSMRRDDVNGARCRSDGVWMSLARDYVKKPLDKKSRSEKDLISIIVMRESASVLFECEPTDFVLYNKLIDTRDWTQLRPSNGGNYLPALDTAESLLLKNSLGSCALSLMFFSDGKPSDRGDFSGRMGKIASKFGRRLSVMCVGMAEPGEDFSTLNAMVTEAESYGCIASFGRPTLDADSLSNIVSSLASSLTSTITEMTNIDTGKSREVRTDICREKMNTFDDLEFNEVEWTDYRNDELHRYVANIWSWNYKLDDFVQFIDPRCSICWKETNALNPSMQATCEGILCPECKTHCFCTNCSRMTDDNADCQKNLQDLRLGRIVHKVVPRFEVAAKNMYFGEGAERLVRKLRFLGEGNKFIGPVMVAKESRFLEKRKAGWKSQKERLRYHSEFMRTQALAAEYAKNFNKALTRLGHDVQGHDEKKLLQNQGINIPRVEFLEPMVIETIDPTKRRGEGFYDILVEPFLEGEYVKFNNNMGMVQDQRNIVKELEVGNQLQDLDSLTSQLSGLHLNAGLTSNNLIGGFNALNLGAIEEGSEEEDEDDDEDEEEGQDDDSYDKCLVVNDMIGTNKQIFTNKETSHNFLHVEDQDVPQAFSHFTYEASKKNFMVVDLQGVLKHNPDGTKVFRMTDPAIHKRKKEKFKKWTFGRTDRGAKGIRAFFQTHECNNLCELLSLKERCDLD